MTSAVETRTSFDAPSLSDETFLKIRDFLHQRSGIFLSDIKKDLVRTRLRKRLVAYEFDSFEDYATLLVSSVGKEEVQAFINCITTNKTEFFRENHHFEFLTEKGLPEIVDARRDVGQRVVRVWCAGCSTGQEAYSLAITLSEFFETRPGWQFQILATDVDSDCLKHALRRTYDEAEIEQLPLHLKRKYLLKGTGPSKGSVQVRQQLAERITFQHLNFADRDWQLKHSFDFIFCRNVIIYFDQTFQEQLIGRFLEKLEPDGLLFLGHSESITWMPELLSLGQTIYRPTQSSRKERKTVRIVAGETHASGEAIEISTLLGSCVAVCLFDPIARVGGMNHVLFAQERVAATQEPCSDSAAGALQSLLGQLSRLGAQESRMVAKLYGGAELFDQERNQYQVGTSNIKAVTSLLHRKGIPIVEQRLGGRHPRRITLQPDTGKVMVCHSHPQDRLC